MVPVPFQCLAIKKRGKKKKISVGILPPFVGWTGLWEVYSWRRSVVHRYLKVVVLMSHCTGPGYLYPFLRDSAQDAQMELKIWSDYELSIKIVDKGGFSEKFSRRRTPPLHDL